MSRVGVDQGDFNNVRLYSKRLFLWMGFFTITDKKRRGSITKIVNIIDSAGAMVGSPILKEMIILPC